MTFKVFTKSYRSSALNQSFFVRKLRVDVKEQIFHLGCRWIRIYDNVAYIVVGIVLRESEDGKPQMLLMQEAKKKCHGKWYIPAGHVEPGETIEVV
jgi:NADH pyrophosphatase NudC (nudix superfamily)